LVWKLTNKSTLLNRYAWDEWAYAFLGKNSNVFCL